MLFDRLFKRTKLTESSHKEEDANNNQKEKIINKGQTIEKDAVCIPTQPKIASPAKDAKPSSKHKRTASKPNNVLVLWWISKKKKGYDKTTNKFPKWFMENYKVDFNRVIEDYLDQGLLEEAGNVVKITEEGQKRLKELDYVVYMHENPQYELNIKDFKSAPNLHKVPLNDITWGVLNNRIPECIQTGMWTGLAKNYANMADLLISEKKYEQALELIFPVAYLETSGMRDDNELTAIMTEHTRGGERKHYLSNGMPDIFLLEINNYFVTVPFMKTQDNLKLEWEEIKRRFLGSAHIRALESVLPFRYFEKEQSFEIFKQAVEAGGSKGIFRLSDVKGKLDSNTPFEHSNKYFYASVENKVQRIMAQKYGKKD